MNNDDDKQEKKTIVKWAGTLVLAYLLYRRWS